MTWAGYSRRSLSTTVIWSLFLITWLLVTISPSARRITPEPSEFCTRCCGTVPPKSLPKNCWKKGSLNSGETLRAWTTRRV
jgi:hypothetical protein